MARSSDRARRTEATRGSRVIDRLALDRSRVSIVAFDGGMRLARHYHDTACLTLVLSGSFAERFDRRTYEVGAATILCKPPGDPHSDAFASDGSRQMILEYGEPSLADLPREHPFRRRARTTSLLALTIGRRIERELAHPDDFSRLAVEGLSLELVALAGRAFHDPPRDLPPWLESVRERLDERLLDIPACEDLAIEAGVDPSTLSRVFRACYGIGMADYARRSRLEWAARELTESARPIPAIALAAGFADQSHFTRWFRRYNGLTPGRYRRERSRHGSRRLTI